MNIIFRLLIFCVILLFTAFAASAGEFVVSPITMEIGQGVNSGVFTVSNEGKEKINFQISLSEWTQDAAGKDVYSETRDIIFSPKLMTVEAGEKRVVRVGLKPTRVINEKTYRIFIEEIPPLKKSEGTKITVAIRFAPPIFVKPAQLKTGGSIEDIKLVKGTISAVVRNTGNVHFKMTSILIKGKSAKGAEVFSKEIAGFYLLNHITRNIEASFPQEKCNELSSVEIEAKTENLNLNGKLDVQKGMCGQ